MSWVWVKVLSGLAFILLPGFSLKSNFEKKPILTILSLILGLFLLFLSAKSMIYNDFTPDKNTLNELRHSDIKEIKRLISDINNRSIHSAIEDLERIKKLEGKVADITDKLNSGRFSKEDSIKLLNTKKEAEIAINGFTPKLPAFPHGDGIYRYVPGTQTICTQKKENPRCQPTGLQLASFNNYIDSSSFVGVNDEREFLIVGKNNSYSDNLLVDHGDIINFRGYIHNNGRSSDSGLTSKNTVTKLSNFYSLGSGHYTTSPAISIQLRQYIAGKTVAGKNIVTVTDTTKVTSANGNKIRLHFVPNPTAFRLFRRGTQTNLNQASVDGFLGAKGVNIEDIKPGVKNSVHTDFFVRVEEIKYDLDISKTVNGKKTISAQQGEKLEIKLIIRNLKGSGIEANNLIIIDEYDPHKILIDSIKVFPKSKKTVLECHDMSSMIFCKAKDIVTPGEKISVVYNATIKKNALGSINNKATICAPFSDSNNFTIPTCIPFDTDKTNNESSINVRLF